MMISRTLLLSCLTALILVFGSLRVNAQNIISPSDGGEYYADDAIQFLVSAIIQDPDTVHWTSDIDGLLGDTTSFYAGALTPGIHNISVTVIKDDSVAEAWVQILVINHYVPTILSDVMPFGAVGVVYDFFVDAVGGDTTQYDFSVTNGALPDGLDIIDSTGQITGTPTVQGNFSFDVLLEDEDTSAVKRFSIFIGDENASRGIVREVYFRDIADSLDLDSLRKTPEFGVSPNFTEIIDELEAPYDIGEDYFGSRLYGYLLPPATGYYQFLIAGDDHVDLYMDTTGMGCDPLDTTRIAHLRQWAGYGDWQKHDPDTTPNQQISDSIMLTAGEAYFIEVDYWDFVFPDGAQVAWIQPGSSDTTVISADYIMPVAPAGCTAPVADNTAPSVPMGLVEIRKSDNHIVVGWGPATDDVAVSGYSIYVDGMLKGSTKGATDTTFTTTGLMPNTQYTIEVSSIDISHNESALSTGIDITTNAPDTEAPTDPANLTADSVSQTSIFVSWDASTDNVGVVVYKIYLDSVLIGHTSGVTPVINLEVDGLDPDTEYSIGLVAYDAAGNASQWVAVIDTTAPDVTPPTKPDLASVAFQDETSITLFGFNSSVDNVGIVEYEFFVNGNPTVPPTIVLPTAFSAVLMDLTAGTEYAITHLARDEAGNESQMSDTLYASTDSAEVTDPTVTTSPTDPTVTEVDDAPASSVSISPNPADTEVTISGGSISSITFTNVIGNVILSGNTATVDISSLSPGVYFVKVLLADGTKEVKRLVVE